MANPLIPFEFYDRFLEVKTASDPVAQMKSLCYQLPPRNLATLTYLLRFFERFFVHFNETKMSPENIAIVFGPNILRDNTIDPKKVATANEATLFLLQHTAEVVG